MHQSELHVSKRFIHTGCIAVQCVVDCGVTRRHHVAVLCCAVCLEKYDTP